MLFSVKVEPNTPTRVDPLFTLVVTQVVLGEVKDKARHFVQITYSSVDSGEFTTGTVAVLQLGSSENVPLQLQFDTGEVFTVSSTAPIFLSGFYIDGEEEDNDDGGSPSQRMLWDSDDELIHEDDDEEDDDDDEDEDDEEDDEDDDEPKIKVLEDIPKKGKQPVEFSSQDQLPKSLLQSIKNKQEREPPKNAPPAKKQKMEPAVKTDKPNAATPGKADKPIAATPAKSAATTPAKADKPAATTPAKADKPAAGTPAKPAAATPGKADKPAAATPGKAQKPAAGTPAPITPAGKVNHPSGLVYEDLTSGSGKKAESGKVVSVKYVGKLTNGKIFDKSRAPFEFNLGNQEVIKGWDIGVQGMKVGGTRKLTIPPGLAYGKKGALPEIPPNSTLEFEVTLLNVK